MCQSTGYIYCIYLPKVQFIYSDCYGIFDYKKTHSSQVSVQWDTCFFHGLLSGLKLVSYLQIGIYFFLISLKHMWRYYLNPLNVELNLSCHLLALLGSYAILHVSTIRVKLGYHLDLLSFQFTIQLLPASLTLSRQSIKSLN
jgi:hypothetical protein